MGWAKWVYVILVFFCLFALFTIAIFIYPSVGQNLDAEARAVLQLKHTAETLQLEIKQAEEAYLLQLPLNPSRKKAVLDKLETMAAPLLRIRSAGRSAFLLINREEDLNIRGKFAVEMAAVLAQDYELVEQLWAGRKPTLNSEVVLLKIHSLLATHETYLDTLREQQDLQFKRTTLIRAGLLVVSIFVMSYWYKGFKRFGLKLEISLRQAVEQQTRQIQAQSQARMEQAEYLKLIYQGSRDAIATIDPDTKTFTSCNAAALVLFGISTEAEFCKEIPGILPPKQQTDDRRSSELFIQKITEALEKGSETFEWLWTRGDGTGFLGLTSLDRLQTGERFFLLCTLRDLTTERELALERQVNQNHLIEAGNRLATREAHYRALFEHSVDAIGTINPATFFYQTANAALLQMFGLPDLPPFIGLSLEDLSPEFQPDGRSSVEARLGLQRQMNEDSYSSIEWSHKRADGSIFPARITQIRIIANGVSVIVATTHDLTRERAEAALERATTERLAAQAQELGRIAEELKMSEARYRAIFEHSAGPVGTIDPYTGRFTSCNPAALALFGISSEAEFLALGPGEISPVFQPNGELSRVKRKRMFTQMLTQNYQSDEWLFQRTNGSNFIALFTLNSISGRGASFILATVRDLTQQKAAEETQQRATSDLQQLAQDRQTQFQLSENRYRSLVDASPDAIIVVAPSGNIELVNPATALLFGYAANELLDQPIELLIPFLKAKDPAVLQSSYPQSLLQHPMTEGAVDFKGRRKNESEFPAEVSLRPIQSPQGPQAICVVRDVSANRAASIQMASMLEQEKNISQMKTQFISVTSHEFRTPMAAALGSVEILTYHLDRLDQVKRQALLGRITASLQQMNRMLDDILVLNQADAGRLKLQWCAVNLEERLQAILDESKLVDREQHTFHLASTTADPTLLSDPNLLQHIFSNLLSNAVRYSPAGTVITLRLRFTVEAAIVELDDQGIGIPLADQARIFEPFERGSNIGQIAGTGLGLNIAQRMVGLLQGTIEVSSRTAGGTTFTVVLPRVTQR